MGWEGENGVREGAVDPEAWRTAGKRRVEGRTVSILIAGVGQRESGCQRGSLWKR